MTTLYIPTVDGHIMGLPTTLGWVHQASTWLLGTTPDVTIANAVAKSVENSTKLTSITLDFDMLPGVTYYSKALVITNNGIIETDTVTLTSPDKIEITYKHPIPSAVMTPDISLEESYTNVPNTMFKILVSDMSTTSNSKIDAVSYIITTLTGETVYSSLYDEDNLKFKIFDDVILDTGRFYIIKVMQHATSDDSSDFASQLIYVSDASLINLTTDVNGITIGTSLPVVLTPIPNLNRITLKIYSVGHGEPVLERSISTASLTTVIPGDTFDSNTKKYILEFTATRHGSSDVGPKSYLLTTN